MLQDKKYTDGMRLFWLLNGIEDFPVCKCKDNGEHLNKSNRCHLVSGYESEYCSSKCAVAESIKKTMSTKAEKYGDPCYRNPKKAKKTSLKHLGVSNPFSSKEIIQRIQAKRKAKSRELMAKAWKTRRENSSEKFA